MNIREQKIEKVLRRGVSVIYPSEDFLKKELQSSKKLKIYLGIDPTGELHLGHVIPLIKLRHFQDLGHKIIVMFGGFTATIGDPTGKMSIRKVLTKDQVEKNTKLYKKQISKILKTGFGGVSFKNNYDWLGKIDLKKFLEILSVGTVDQLLERDMFQERKIKNQPIFLHEFLYPILQGYDSVALGVDGEIGGNDQIFNMLSGRNFVKIFNKKEKFVLATKLLADNTGKKMGKTEGNAVNLSDTPANMFGKIMSWSDELILPAFELLTDVSDEKITEIKEKMNNGENPKDFKMSLAEEITTFWHGKNKAIKSKNNFIEMFSNKQIPKDVLTIQIKEGDLLADVLVHNQIAPSKSEFQRLIQSGAIKLNGQKILDPKILAKEGDYKIGKRTFVRLKNN